MTPLQILAAAILAVVVFHLGWWGRGYQLRHAVKRRYREHELDLTLLSRKP